MKYENQIQRQREKVKDFKITVLKKEDVFMKYSELDFIVSTWKGGKYKEYSDMIEEINNRLENYSSYTLKENRLKIKELKNEVVKYFKEN